MSDSHLQQDESSVKDPIPQLGDSEDEFLKSLRAAGTFQNTDSSENEDTIRANNRSQPTIGRHFSSLSELFESPPAVPNASLLPAPKHGPKSSFSSLIINSSPGDSSTSRNGSERHQTHSTAAHAGATMPPRPPPFHKHNRSVSWGVEEVTTNTERRITNRNALQQPALDETTMSPKKKLDINEVLAAHPFEAEVETNILRAIDERQQQRNRSDTMGASTIASQSFDLSSPNSCTRDESADAPQDVESGFNQQDNSEKKPFLKTKRHHRRGDTVEHVLLDLTEAMKAIHDEKSRGQLQEQQQLQDEHQESQQQKPPLRHPPASAEDFATNVVRIAEQREETRKKTNFVTRFLPTINESRHSSMGNVNESSVDGAGMESGTTPPSPTSNHHSGKKRWKRRTIRSFKDDIEVWNGFFRPRQGRVFGYIKMVLFCILVPLTGIAAILFYLVGNPPTGESADQARTEQASTSWILLFCARQIITFSLALLVQLVFIDFVALDTSIMSRLVGPIVTLVLVQSRGWPFLMFWWCIFDFAMLSGNGAFAHHWMYWQSQIRMCNASNPSGNVVNNDWYRNVLIVAISVSCVVALKRFLVGLYLGRQTFSYYGQQLADVMNKMLLVSEVAGLAKEIEKAYDEKNDTFIAERTFGVDRDRLFGMDYSEDDEKVDDDDLTFRTVKSRQSFGTDKVIDMSKRNPLTGSLQASEKIKLMQLLERWEDPAKNYLQASGEITSISAVLRFQKALTFIKKRYPFSLAFGPADNREACIDSAQRVYCRLLKGGDEQVLSFETIAVLALDDNREINQLKAKDLVRVFRPDRNGNLSMLDFVKSCDMVYKEFRLLGASIDNSSQIDRAFERLFNVVFYAIVLIVVLSQLGFNPLALLVSIGSVLLGFAFIIGSASSKYFEGVLFILARRPYGIGDLIQVGNVESDTSLHGVLPWLVENVTLFETTVKHLPTNEFASLSNGSLANCRIINWARSPQAQFHIFLNFPLDTPYEKILIFKSAIEEYMKARPREWRALNGFRANRVVANENYIEYLIVIQHREAWQQVGQVLDSKANLSSYCLEVARQLNMHYQAPRLPVDLRYTRAEPGQMTRSAGSDLDTNTLTREFQSIARNKHNIRVC